ncbi:MAG: methyl-accepting chemotaxis protein [Patescibacteria group bacterium]
MEGIFNRIPIRTKIFFLVAILNCTIAAQGVLGIYAVRSYFNQAETGYVEGTVSVEILGRITTLLAENKAEILAALQHNPVHEESKLHDHPATKHLEAVEKNAKEVGALIKTYADHPQSEAEKTAFAKFVERREAYAKELEKAKSAISEGQWMKAAAAYAGVSSKFTEAKTAAEELSSLLNSRTKDGIEGLRTDYNWRLPVTVAGVALSAVFGIGFGLLIALSIKNRIARLSESISKTETDKDLSANLMIPGGDEISEISGKFANLMKTIREMVADIKHLAAEVGQGAGGIRHSAGEIRSDNANLSDSVSQIAASTEELSVSISEVGTNAESAASLVRDKTRALIAEGSESVNRAVGEMRTASESIHKSNDEVAQLAVAVDDIAKLAGTISEIAKQTNLLALNAAIEAARAGEAGRGFSVVADEVRKLSESTEKATKAAAEQIANVCALTETIRKSMRESVATIEHGEATGEQAISILASARESGEQAALRASDISSAVLEQVRAIETVSAQLERIAQASEQASAEAETVFQVSEALNGTSEGLVSSVSRFKT